MLFSYYYCTLVNKPVAIEKYIKCSFVFYLFGNMYYVKLLCEVLCDLCR